MEMAFNTLPSELLLQIFGHLNPSDLFTAGMVCNNWRCTSRRSTELWQVVTVPDEVNWKYPFAKSIRMWQLKFILPFIPGNSMVNFGG
jgi:hypothetical protein